MDANTLLECAMYVGVVATVFFVATDIYDRYYTASGKYLYRNKLELLERADKIHKNNLERILINVNPKDLENFKYNPFTI